MTASRADLALLGVTGYTGQLALAYLGSLAPEAVGRVVLAGRDPARVTAARDAVAPRLDAEVVPADASDPAAMRALAERARVVVHLAGPYAERGPALVQACAALGTHYVDLSGEPLFMRDMIAQHHERAEASGARIVHASGFESLPFDVLTGHAVDTLHARFGAPCAEVQLSVQMRMRDRAIMRDAVFSGGTVATLRSQLQETRGEQLVDPALLLPPDADREAVRRAHPLPGGAVRDPLTGAWATPVYPAPTLNPQVLLRSAALAGARGGYAPDFRYRECATLAGMVDGAMQRTAAATLSRVVLGMMGVVESGRPWQRNALTALLERFGARTGEGPKHALLDSFDYTLRARATTTTGEAMAFRWEGRGNPGYRSTAKLVVQAGLCLAHDGAQLPPRAGVLTPWTGLGRALLSRLPAAAVSLRDDDAPD